MSPAPPGRRKEFAIDQLARGQVLEAIDTLAELLGDEPDDAEAHALLAICLVRRKRLHAARLEAQTAVAGDPELPVAHIAAGVVSLAHRRFADAERHLLEAGQLDPGSDLVQRELAHLYRLWHKPAQARECAAQALAMDPGNTANVVLAGELALDGGEPAEAREKALQALEEDPEHVDALVLLGRADLAAGDAGSARKHAVWALQQDPEDEGARTLLASVKARSNWLLGLWWRFQSWITAGSHTRAVLLLVGLYVAYRSGVILLQGQGANPRIVQVLQIAWLGFCIYTWLAPALFLRALRKEMEQVNLRADF